MNNRLRDLASAAPFLVVTAAVMVVDLLICLVGLIIDHTVITGMPAWMKPAKFAISTGIYALSVAIIIRYTPVWRKTLRVIEFLIGTALTLEIVLIDLQAARHTTSHFNIATDLNAAIWSAMAVSIGVFWLASIVVTAATFRVQYRSRVWTIATRYGMLLAVLGTATGMFMAVPSQAQIQQAKFTHDMPIAGSHTIGAPDGGKGLPVVGWSTQHGDVRVAHFAGLHGLQLFALGALFMERRRIAQGRSVRIMTALVMSYWVFFAITLTQALSGEPITQHDAGFRTVWVFWLALSAVFFFVAARKGDLSVGSEATA